MSSCSVSVLYFIKILWWTKCPELTMCISCYVYNTDCSGLTPGFLKLFSENVCVCVHLFVRMHVCLHICLSFRDHVSKPLTGISNPFTGNKS